MFGVRRRNPLADKTRFSGLSLNHGFLPLGGHWYLHNFQFFVTYSVARDWAAFNGGGSLVNFSVTMDRPQCEGPPHNEGSGEISTRAEGVVAHGVILLLHVDLENRIPRGLTLT